jgi:hypothetical protein
MDLLWNIVSTLFLGLGFGAGVSFAVLFALWFVENRNE